MASVVAAGWKRQATEAQRVTLIICPTYATYQRICRVRADKDEDRRWFANRDIARRWVDRCIERGVRLEVLWILN